MLAMTAPPSAIDTVTTVAAVPATEPRREARRVVLPGKARLCFWCGGRPFMLIPLGNISHGGCLGLLPSSEGKLLQPGMAIEDMVILHAGHVIHPIQARVMWCLGDDSNDRVAVGFQFQEMSSATRIALVSTIDGAIIDQVVERL